jgi:hypothetical protein
MAQNQCFHRNRVVKKNWPEGFSQHGGGALPDIFSIAPPSLREGDVVNFFYSTLENTTVTSFGPHARIYQIMFASNR